MTQCRMKILHGGRVELTMKTELPWRMSFRLQPMPREHSRGVKGLRRFFRRKVESRFVGDQTGDALRDSTNRVSTSRTSSQWFIGCRFDRPDNFSLRVEA